jgi:triacylglycerol lipase
MLLARRAMNRKRKDGAQEGRRACGERFFSANLATTRSRDWAIRSREKARNESEAQGTSPRARRAMRLEQALEGPQPMRNSAVQGNRKVGLGFGLVGLACLGAASLAGAQAGPAVAPTSDACATKNPIVLAEGLNSVAHFGVVEALQDCGARVFTTDVDASNTSLVRGPQLLEDIQMVLATTGATKVNVFAHSQGGLDSRVILKTNPEVLASIVQAGTPNLGSKVADLGTSLPPDIAAGMAGAIIAIGGSVGTDPVAANQFLTTAGTAQFNRDFPAGLPTEACGSGPAMANGVVLLSFGGTSPSTNAADPSDQLLTAGAAAFGAEENDGLVARCSTHFGTVLRDDFPMNHFDLLNQVKGVVGPQGPSPIEVYRSIAMQLKEMGL